MSFPWTDWQFWLVTAIAAWGASVLVRPFLPRGRDASPCANCVVGTSTHAAVRHRQEPVTTAVPIRIVRPD
jgi:hypothetical protein